MLRIGLHSSRPSCQQSESSVTAPAAALRRSSEIRTGPTGTPLIATYHSSVTDTSMDRAPADPEGEKGTVAGASCTFLWNALESALGGACDTGGRGFVAERLVARLLRGAGGRGACGGPGGALATLVSVTAARTSIWWPHLRHFMRTVLPATFSSAIWYLALQLSQRNFKGAPRYCTE